MKYANATFSVKVDTSGFTAVELELLAQVKNAAVPLKSVALQIGKEIKEEIFGNKHVYALEWFNNGSTFRGESRWRKPAGVGYVAPGVYRYPTWGDPPRVAGRLRPSGYGLDHSKSTKVKAFRRKAQADLVAQFPKLQKAPAQNRYRVQPGSRMMVDTGKMIREFTGKGVLSDNNHTITLTTNREYAQHQNSLRPYNKPTRSDVALFKKTIKEWLGAMAKRINQRRARGRAT